MTSQLRTNWVQEFDALVKQVHPLHPGHLGRMPLAYNWTVHQSEWATDVTFRSREDLEEVYKRWVRHAFLNYTSMDVMRFLGRSKLNGKTGADVRSDVKAFEESVRLKHWANGNSLKAYDHCNNFRPETTINNPKEFRSYRAAVGDPEGPKSWRPLQRSVADMHRRAEASQKANERYLESLASVAADKTLEELVSP